MNPTANLSFNEKGDKWMQGELQIKDVCEGCNGINLSALDAYAKGFIQQNRLQNFIHDQNRVAITYDFCKLSRFLLKIIYNNQRARNETDTTVRDLRKYILEGKKSQLAHRVIKIYLEIRRCPRFNTNRPKPKEFPQEIWDLGYQPPKAMTAGRVVALKMGQQETIARHVTLNNYKFYVLIFSEETKEERRSTINRLQGQMQDTFELRPKRKSLTAEVSNESLVDWHMSDARYANQWQDYISKNPIN